MENQPNFSGHELEQDENNTKNRVNSAVENRVDIFRRPHVPDADIGVLIADLRRKF